MTPLIIGIAGGSASGKTLFLERMLRSFDPAQICLLSLDNYYKEQHLQTLDEKGIYNYDTPDSINSMEFIRDLKILQSGQTVQRLEYTFNNPARIAALLLFQPAPIIVVEGIFVLYYPELSTLLDLKVFIDAKEHIKLKRRIARDKVERGYDPEDVLYRYENHIAPTYEKYIEPCKHEADLIIPNNHDFKKGLEVLISYMKLRLQLTSEK